MPLQSYIAGAIASGFGLLILALIADAQDARRTQADNQQIAERQINEGE